MTNYCVTTYIPSCKETHLFVFHYTFMHQILLFALLTFHLKCIELRIVCFFLCLLSMFSIFDRNTVQLEHI